MRTQLDRERLVRIIKDNRTKHDAIFQEAVEGYRVAAIEKLNAAIDEIKSGTVIRSYWQIPVPEHHLDEYDRIIGLLDMSTEKQVTMTDVEFESYVQDKWSWTKAFIASNSYYSQTARALQGDNEEE